VGRNRKAGQNPPRVVAPIEEEEENSFCSCYVCSYTPDIVGLYVVTHRAIFCRVLVVLDLAGGQVV
jgi:hypothetical protein